MIPRKIEVLQEMGLMFLNGLNIGDKFKVKSKDKDVSDTVEFDAFNDIHVTFMMEGKRYGVFFQQIRDGDVEISKIES